MNSHVIATLCALLAISAFDSNPVGSKNSNEHLGVINTSPPAFASSKFRSAPLSNSKKLAPLFGPTWRDTAIESSKADAVGSLVLQNRLHNIWSERIETKHSTHVAHVNLIGGCQFFNCRILTRLQLFLPFPGASRRDNRLRFQQLAPFLGRA